VVDERPSPLGGFGVAADGTQSGGDFRQARFDDCVLRVTG